ncbi:hypothetical protein DFS33DRAFT_471457 [Desarmillaria ectypa]|nr:hypothetical protein DFS33DRAFT_471457 [Desarmillaria ectypa]
MRLPSLYSLALLLPLGRRARTVSPIVTEIVSDALDSSSRIRPGNSSERLKGGKTEKAMGKGRHGTFCLAFPHMSRERSQCRNIIFSDWAILSPAIQIRHFLNATPAFYLINGKHRCEGIRV